MTELCAPLTPPDCDLTDFQYMELDVRRLRDSRFAATPNSDAFRAGILLWCAAWHQVPAASLPDDDIELASLAGYGRMPFSVKEWRKVRTEALHGYVKCSDGRLYHPVVAEKANAAFNAKLDHAYGKFTDRLRKENKSRAEKKLPSVGIPTFEQWRRGEYPHGIPPETLKPSAGIPAESDRNSAGIPATDGGNSGGIPAENALRGNGEGEGEGDIKEQGTEVASTVGDGVGAADRTAPGEAPPDPPERVEQWEAHFVRLGFPASKVRTVKLRKAAEGWIAARVTLAQMATAIACGDAKNGGRPDSPLWYANFVREVMQAGQSREPNKGEDAPWWESASGVERYGASIGITRREGEAWPYFRDRVIAAAGDGPWAEKVRGTVTYSGFQAVGKDGRASA